MQEQGNSLLHAIYLFVSIIHYDKEGMVEDSDFVGLAISDAAELRENSLLPFMKELFERNYVDQLLYHSFEDIEKEVNSPPDSNDKMELKNIYNRYDEVINTWDAYMEEDGASSDEIDALFDSIVERTRETRMAREETERRPESSNPFPKVGRNDPCPCGSGKKYKKCCLVR